MTTTNLATLLARAKTVLEMPDNMGSNGSIAHQIKVEMLNASLELLLRRFHESSDPTLVLIQQLTETIQQSYLTKVATC
jgi:hypothetical protein